MRSKANCWHKLAAYLYVNYGSNRVARGMKKCTGSTTLMRLHVGSKLHRTATQNKLSREAQPNASQQTCMAPALSVLSGEHKPYVMLHMSHVLHCTTHAPHVHIEPRHHKQFSACFLCT